MTKRMVRETHTALTEAAADPSLRVLLLTGEGTSFCPGADLNWATSVEHDAADTAEGTTDFLDAETGIRYNVGPWMARRGDPRGPSNAHVRAYM